MTFKFKPLEISEVILVEPKAFEDDRGCFVEIYKRSEFEAYGIREVFIQDNYSYSHRNVLRGLHYQKAPSAQGKLVIVIRGEIFDVAVDIRKGSPTYGHWVAAKLSGLERQMLYVPAGFAHGFCALSEEAYVVYKVTAEYAPDAERGIRWNDPDLSISWPTRQPNLSPKDAELPFLRNADNEFVFERRSS